MVKSQNNYASWKKPKGEGKRSTYLQNYWKCKLTHSDRKISDCLGTRDRTGNGRTGRLQRGTGNFWGDGYVHYLGCGNGFIWVDAYVKLSKLCTLNMSCLLCVNYTSVKLLKKRCWVWESWGYCYGQLSNDGIFAPRCF